MELLQLSAQSFTGFAQLVWEDAMAPSPKASCMLQTMEPVDLYMQPGQFDGSEAAEWDVLQAAFWF